MASSGPTLSTHAATNIAGDDQDASWDPPPPPNRWDRPPTPPPPSQPAAKLRKRTKTGCLTCRKRRIKCGEERPICNNCIKSKRHCEGYNQRVIFKAPIGEWPNHQSTVNTLPYHSSLLPGTRPVFRQHQPPVQQQTQGPLTATQFDFANPGSGPIPGLDPLNTRALGGPPPQYQQDPSYPQQPLPSPHSHLPTPISAASYLPSPSHANFPPQFAGDGGSAYQGQQYPRQGHFQPVSYDTQAQDAKPAISEASYPPVAQAYQIGSDQFGYQQHPQSHQHQQHQHQTPPNVHEEHDPYLASNNPPRADEYQQHQFIQHRPPLEQVGPRRDSHALPTPIDMPRGPYAPPPPQPDRRQSIVHTQIAQIPQSVQLSYSDVAPDVKYVPQHTVPEQSTAVSHVQEGFVPGLYTSGFAADHISPTYALDEAAVEYEDDDYYDVQSDEEMEDAPEQEMISNRDFGMILRLHEESISDLSIRRYDTFIYEGILDFYRAEWVANPLKNPATARVFAHFVYATGPSMSIYERNPRNSSAMFSEGPVPSSQQSLWTYHLPMLALSHQGLLHAMLALSSLHIAKLQGAAVTPSYKHYAYSLKRLHHCLGHPTKRHLVTTLATSLLLAFYEVFAADHVKWSSHLTGAKLLVVETDFRGMTAEARRIKAEQAAYESSFAYQNPEMLMSQRKLSQGIKDLSSSPDENLVSTIIGRKLTYDDFSRVTDYDDQPRGPSTGIPKQLDLSKYEMFQDLYWWYCRMDAFQSIVSGNKLIMDYSRWSDCPPRAPCGRADQCFGTHDHVILLLGRIADFASRDRERKIKQVEANGGQWRPMPGMPMGPPASSSSSGGPGPKGPPNIAPSPQAPGPPRGPPQRQGPPGGPPSGPPQLPPFYGMAPTRGPSAMPSSYALPTSQAPRIPSFSDPRPSPQSQSHDPSEPLDLPSAYTAALTHWSSIRAALFALEHSLGPSFAPLGPSHAPPLNTPFGPALQYRSYDVAIIWGMLHMCHIILLRAHPGMPPAAMQAAGVAGKLTEWYAEQIGRLAAGILMPGADNTYEEDNLDYGPYGATGDAKPTPPLNPSLGAALIESTMPLFFAGIQYTSTAHREWVVSRLLDIELRSGWATAGQIARGCETSWVRAFQAGRGPFYERKREQEVLQEERRGKVTEERYAERGFVVHYATRYTWASGILD
ncbi:uncharacterized protein BDZ99DRAFT_574414 [Mytilinidion resinicola]|uniref:Zn(2)-C6 fungal-type domain-containing protein n=1 Tax=Mytilinidion resinicola TaxID=574789 RepID=A0A6A6Y9J7_9PEZI|nr:uncharacterized protein BDZ99DRAFT_574414 [Mytilinidion resinicola]KAF2805486.1 hypothetical protein BDZ99DRAFT_574414 [Mytilinidion resinicola]